MTIRNVESQGSQGEPRRTINVGREIQTLRKEPDFCSALHRISRDDINVIYYELLKK